MKTERPQQQPRLTLPIDRTRIVWATQWKPELAALTFIWWSSEAVEYWRAGRHASNERPAP
jgi:hypothetical protein